MAPASISHPTNRLFVLLFSFLFRSCTLAFHDCIEASAALRRRRLEALTARTSNTHHIFDNIEGAPCAGGICVGMTNGPHQGGNASYPVSWDGERGTLVQSSMTVPELPKLLDGITYYMWTDVFFGDASLGRMNQLVPQLLLGSVLDSSLGPPNYEPKWHRHITWVFGAHYFFETLDPGTNETQAHAAYGNLHPTWPGETLYTSFSLSPGGDGMDAESPKWTLTMGVVGDDTRVSKLVVERPYMGIGAEWKEPTVSWAEPAYKNMCINACWELYGASDAAHLPSSGARYDLNITQPKPGSYNYTSWERDEANGECPSCKVTESHGELVQDIQIEIDVNARTIDHRMT